MTPAIKRTAWITAAKACFSVALFVTVIALNRDAFSNALSQRPSFSLALLGLGLYLAGVMLAFIRWHVLVRAVDLPFSRHEAFQLGWVGMFFNLVIPGAVGGDIVKAAYLARSQELKSLAVATVVIDRLVGLIGLFMLAALGGALAWSSFPVTVRPIIVSAWVSLGITLLITLAAFWIRPAGPLTRRLSARPRTSKMIWELHAMGVAYRKRFPWVLLAVGMASFTHLLNVCAFASVARAFGGNLITPSLLGYFTVVPLVLFSTAIPLPFSGLGASEGVSALLFRTLDYSGGAVAMIGFRMLQLCAAGIGAVYYASVRNQSSKLPTATLPHAAPSLRVHGERSTQIRS
jgi:uncharacterized protein (TIRG00374 family)